MIHLPASVRVYSGNVYAADVAYNVVRKIGADGTVTTVAGVPPDRFSPAVTAYFG